MTPAPSKQDNVIDKVMKLSAIGPAGEKYRHGVPLRVLQETDPLATEEDLSKITPQEAAQILRELWVDYGCVHMKDTKLAMDVFVFAMVFGVDVAAWLLFEAASVTKVDRSYIMREPPKGFKIDGRTVIKLSNDGKALEKFRMLTSGYIGWLNRIEA